MARSAVRACAAGLVGLVVFVPGAAAAQAKHGLLGAAGAASPGPALAVPGSTYQAPGRPGDGVRIDRASTLAGSQQADLFGVKALSASDAWAVGERFCVTSCSIARTLTRHWDGTSWSTVPSPNGSTSSSFLYAVTADSAADAWAVGNYCTTASCAVQDTLILHWNGTGWAKVASPNVAAAVNELDGVSVVSATDAWAVGYSCQTAPFCTSVPETLLLHWNGTTWSRMTAASTSVNGRFSGVTADSATDAWAVGYSCSACGTASEVDRTLILHWNGTTWTKATSPNPSTSSNRLSGVTAISATAAWAVGGYSNDKTGAEEDLILRWNGTTWTKAPAPNPSTSSNGLLGVTASSATGAWAAGTYCASGCGTASEVLRTLILHWNGTTWSKVKSPNPGTGWSLLYAVNADSAADAWAVGYSCSACGTSSEVDQALTLRWNGTTWSAN